MDEKLTPADVLRKGIDAVADAENKGINVEKDAETQFSLSVDDDAVEFSSFSIDDNRDTTPEARQAPVCLLSPCPQPRSRKNRTRRQRWS